MDILNFKRITNLFILTLKQRDDGQEKQILETRTTKSRI